MTRRFKHLLATAFGLLLSGGLWGVSAAQPTAAAADAHVVLHKLIFTDLPAATLNDGVTQPDFDTAAAPLNGVTFTAYDVTAAFWQAVAADPAHDVEAAQTELAATTPKAAARVQSQVTAGAGTAAFTLPNRSGGRYAAYLFKETGAPAGITTSQNLVILMAGDTTQLDLFPKDQLVGGHAGLTKRVADGRAVRDIGAAIPYQMRVRVPANIGALSRFTLRDVADSRLVATGKLTVAAGGKPVTGYTLALTAHGFTLRFDPAKLIGLANRTLVVHYQMRIAPGTAPDAPLVNRTTLYPGTDTPQTDTATVETGGQRFVKVDAVRHAVKLKAAAFVVQNAAGRYLTQGATGWRWVTRATPTTRRSAAGLTVLTSDAAGRFAIAGLAAGKYRLREVQAPKGYLRSTKAIPFTVIAGSDTAGRTAPYRVINVATPTRRATVPPLVGHLPQTGEEWAAWLSVVGVLVIGAVVAIRTKIKTH